MPGSGGTKHRCYLPTVYGEQELVRVAGEYTAADLAGQERQHQAQITNQKKRKQSALVEQGHERCQHCHTLLVGDDDPEQEPSSRRWRRSRVGGSSA